MHDLNKYGSLVFNEPDCYEKSTIKSMMDSANGDLDC